ncbi:uncharacterized protein M421DRAFT_77698, partial [Didymella exigua CBS 183.55]
LSLMANYGSYRKIAFIKYCHRYWILLLVFPPHSTHALQLLDVMCFSLSAHNYSKVVT